MLNLFARFSQISIVHDQASGHVCVLCPGLFNPFDNPVFDLVGDFLPRYGDLVLKPVQSVFASLKIIIQGALSVACDFLYGK